MTQTPTVSVSALILRVFIRRREHCVRGHQTCAGRTLGGL